MQKPIKILLIILLFGCLIDFSYGYYQFVRFTAMISFCYFAFSANQQGYKNEVFIYIALALLLQPFFKITLGRTIWNIVDVVIGIGLLVSLISYKKNIE